MLQWLDSVASDSRCPNSPLIDFNGEILISFWPRSASKGQIICWGNAGHTVLWSQSIILTWSTKEKRKKEEERKSNLCISVYIQNQVLQACKAERGRQRQECRYLQHWLQLIWILMMCLLSGNAQQITADGITVRMPWTGNEDLRERVYILFKQLSAWAGERDPGNVLWYNSVVVPPSLSDNRLANGKPSITISLLFQQCLHSPQLSERELE